MARIAAIKSSADLPAALAILEKSGRSRAVRRRRRPGPQELESHHRERRPGRPEPAREELLPLAGHEHAEDPRRVRRGTSRTCSSSTARATPTRRRTRRRCLTIETKFAQASMDRVTMRNPDAMYHVMTVAQFDSIAPRHQVGDVPHGAGRAVGPQRRSTSSQPDFFKAMDGFLTSIPVDDWKTLLRWRLLNTSADPLPKRFGDERLRVPQDLHGPEGALAAMADVRATTRTAYSAKRSARNTSTRTFTPAAKARAKAIVDNMVSVLHDQIGQLDWMSDSTKTAGARQARRVHAQDRLSRQVARLLEARGRASASTTATSARSSEWSASAATGPRSASRSISTEWGMTPPAGERVLQPDLERDRLSRRHSPAAVLRSERRRRA